MERRIIIAGTRTFSDYELLRKVMSQTFGSLSMQEIQEMKIVSGGCQGADMIGETFAQQRSDLRSFSRKLESVRKKSRSYKK